MKKTVLLSGGMDSVTLLHKIATDFKNDNILALSFNYGQKHFKELDDAAWQCKQLTNMTTHKIIDLTFLGALINNASALTGKDCEIPTLNDIQEKERQQPPTYVPNRNMILLSLAASFAESNDCFDIYYGAQAQDEYGYWDCTVEFIEKINNVLNLNRVKPVKIHAPFVNMKKAELLKIGIDLNVDYSKTWTCYRGGKTACGNCPTCIERLNAFKNLNIQDPLKYQ